MYVLQDENLEFQRCYDKRKDAFKALRKYIQNTNSTLTRVDKNKSNAVFSLSVPYLTSNITRHLDIYLDKVETNKDFRVFRRFLLRDEDLKLVGTFTSPRDAEIYMDLMGWKYELLKKDSNLEYLDYRIYKTLNSLGENMILIELIEVI